MIASALSASMEETRVAGMTATLLTSVVALRWSSSVARFKRSSCAETMATWC